MSAYNTTLHDEDDNEIYPKTLAENVYDGNTRMDQKVDGIRTDLGSPSSASAVTGADAFSKISTLNSELTNKASTTNYIYLSQYTDEADMLQKAGQWISDNDFVGLVSGEFRGQVSFLLWSAKLGAGSFSFCMFVEGSMYLYYVRIYTSSGVAIVYQKARSVFTAF
jgi:hypothetical protein